MDERSLEQLDRAYAAGDHQRARAIAKALVSAGADPAAVDRARSVLAQTEPDWFLSAIGGLGLGLTLWLVYNYWL